MLLDLGAAQAVAEAPPAQPRLHVGDQQVAQQLRDVDRIDLGVGGREAAAAQAVPVVVGLDQSQVVDLLEKARRRDGAGIDRVGREIGHGVPESQRPEAPMSSGGRRAQFRAMRFNDE
jgi:hypothetical protein